MSRHRDVRCIMSGNGNYDEFDYDDVYGHSVEDDCVSPSAEQYLFDRSKQQKIVPFFGEPEIKEDDEEDLEDTASSYKLPQLSDLDTAKFISCLESVKNVTGDTHPESEISRKIIEFNFNSEAVLNSIFEGGTIQQKEAAATAETQIGNKPTLPKVVPRLNEPTIKIVRAARKSIVKGFDLNASENLELLTTPRSQSPCSGRNTPDPLYKDDLNQRDKKQTALINVTKLNPSRSQSPASATDDFSNPAKTPEEEKRDALAIYKSNREGCKDQLHLVVVGHVDAGKSTLMGKMLCDLGQVSQKLMHKYQKESKKIGKQSFAFAWVLDETSEERERGITMDVGYSKFETKTKFIILLDAPGHRDFIPNMITGATQADVALLVVDATTGEFETGFESGGQTREHALLLKSLGVSQIAVVVNKLDTVGWSEDRFNEIVNKIGSFLKQIGFRDTIIHVPCSGLSGENIVNKPKEEALSSWYTGPTLIEVIDNFKSPERPVDKPLRFSVNDVFKNLGSTFSISGHMETGMVSTGDKVLVLPTNETGIVKGIQVDEAYVSHAFAGDQAALTLLGIDQQNISIGNIVCSPKNPVPVTSRFEVHVVVFATKFPITIGIPVVLHLQSLVEPATVTKLIAQLNRSTGEVIKKKPRCLLEKMNATIEITTQRPICVELPKNVKQLGRVTLRIDGGTVAAGLVTKIK